MSVLPSPEQKSLYVRRMFDAIARRYDLLNRIMTFGLDQGWRRYAVREVATAVLPTQPVIRVLDVGTGTGDFLPLLAGALPGAVVAGIDFSLPMMRAGHDKAEALGGRGGYVGGDALKLPFADDTFDAITTGFAMRNVADLPAALLEIRRVTRPGGRIACLEVAQPASRLLRLGHRIYFSQIVPRIGRLISRHRDAYSYLPQSAERFPPPDELSALLLEAGWHRPYYRLLGLGAVAAHTAEA